MRGLVGTVAEDFEDVAAMAEPLRRQVLDPDLYSAAQAYGRAVRDSGASGVVYPSVRRVGGTCVGAFRSRAVGIPRQERHLKYRWNGERVDRYFDYKLDAWIEV